MLCSLINSSISHHDNLICLCLKFHVSMLHSHVMNWHRYLFLFQHVSLKSLVYSSMLLVVLDYANNCIKCSIMTTEGASIATINSPEGKSQAIYRLADCTKMPTARATLLLYMCFFFITATVENNISWTDFCPLIAEHA